MMQHLCERAEVHNQLSKVKPEPVTCQRLVRERWQGADPALHQDKSFPA